MSGNPNPPLNRPPTIIEVGLENYFETKGFDYPLFERMVRKDVPTSIIAKLIVEDGKVSYGAARHYVRLYKAGVR